MIIGLTGVAHSGKSSVAHVLKSKYGFKEYSFAEGVYESLYRLDPVVLIQDTVTGSFTYPRLRGLVDELGWFEAKKFPMVRELLQRMGTECGREIHGYNVWVERTFDKIYDEVGVEYGFDGALVRVTGDVVIPDVRFDNEAREIMLQGGHVIEVDRGLGPVNYHKSEAGLSPEHISGTIDNRGTLADLEYNVEMMLRFIGYENIR